MLSIPHLIIIFLVALIVLGPEKLPEVARTLTKAMAEFRSVTSGMKETLEREMRDLEREINETKGASPQPASSESYPALNAAENTSETQEPPAEQTPDPAGTPESLDTGELATTAENPFPADPADTAEHMERREVEEVQREAGEVQEVQEEPSNQSAEATPGKPTDEHTTAV